MHGWQKPFENVAFQKKNLFGHGMKMILYLIYYLEKG